LCLIVSHLTHNLISTLLTSPASSKGGELKTTSVATNYNKYTTALPRSLLFYEWFVFAMSLKSPNGTNSMRIVLGVVVLTTTKVLTPRAAATVLRRTPIIRRIKTTNYTTIFIKFI